MDPSSVVCTNCKKTTDFSGKIVWICEHCGVENPPPPEPTLDSSEAQAAINAALPGTTSAPPIPQQ